MRHSIRVLAVAFIPVCDKLLVISSDAYFAEDPAGIFNAFELGNFIFQSLVGLNGNKVVPGIIWDEEPSPPTESVWSGLILFLSICIPR